MKFYRLKDSGLLVGTQAEAKKSDEEWEEFHIETDKDSLMALYNGFIEVQKVHDEPSPSTMKESVAVQIVSEVEDGKSTVDSAIDLILSSGYTTLSRLAMAVSTRYAEMAKLKGRKR